MKIKEMADVFLNLANFVLHGLSTLAPSSGYALNLKALIKVSKVSCRSKIVVAVVAVAVGFVVLVVVVVKVVAGVVGVVVGAVAKYW